MARYLILFIIIISMSGTFAATTGKIAGRIIDRETGEGLIGSNIIVDAIWFDDMEIDMAEKMGAVSDGDGYYFIINVPPGTYTIKARMMGYKTRTVQQVRVLVDKTSTLDFSLEVETLEGEEVVVVAERKMIQLDMTSTSANVSSEVINSLPVESFQDIVNLQAGVVEGHFRGGRQGEVVYMMNGISINDAYSGEPAFEVENNVIEQLEVISGTFNAEYGQAMSGVVNIVTKEGSENFQYDVTAYGGDYFTNHTDIFWNKDQFDPGNIYNLDMSATGPLIPALKNKITFFSALRLNKDNGAMWGKQRFLPGDSSDFSSDNSDNWVIGESGNGDYVAMNDNYQFTYHGKLTFRLTGSTKFSLEGLFQNREFKHYDHLYRLNPEGDVDRFLKSGAYTLMLNHTFSPKTFIDFKTGYFSTNRYYHLFDNWNDPGYQPEEKLRMTSGSAFYAGGSKNEREDRTTGTFVNKLELTSQVTRVHQLKAGLEFRKNKLDYEYLETIISPETDWQPDLPSRESPLNNKYSHEPTELSFYLQDKMEFKEVIVNAGLRYDYFDPAGHVPSDLNFPDTSPLKESSVKQQWSPRVGIAYPISDRGVLHISYGHFFQVPNYTYLYENSEFEVAVRSFPVIGNSDLNPQRTITYEFGLQQQLTDYFALDVTAFYKDVRDLLATEIKEKKDTYDKYARYINKDYGMVKGLTLALEKRHSDLIGGSIDYTYQVAKGNASDPQSVWMDNQKDPPQESERKMVPLDWDRRHSLNVSLFVGDLKTYNVSFISRFGSGLPYTPAYQNQRTSSENSARKPAYFNLDVYGYRYFKLGRHKFNIFLKIYNVLDRKNEMNVFADTGRAGYTLAPEFAGKIRGVNTADEFYARPDFYSPPRKILLGFTFKY